MSYHPSVIMSYWQRGFDGKEGPSISDYPNVYAYRHARGGWLNGRRDAQRPWAGGFAGSPAEEDKLSEWSVQGRSHLPFNPPTPDVKEKT